MADSSHADPPHADFFMAALWDAAQPAGISVPGYNILDEISRGGMGAVYHARQLRPEREVALKVLLPHLAEEPEMLARFQLEARAMAALDHPGILPVYEVGEADGMPFFSMKLATGGTLSERLRNEPLPPKDAAALMIQLTRAVHHAHQHGVLHRDLKPGNFLFLENGQACVSDFGLAKLSTPDHGPLTRTESFFGTPHYMPPEVAAGSAGDATVAGDLYSMGAVFYECLTGRRPHPAKENVAALLRSIADDPITPPSEVDPQLPRDLSVICMKALEKKPSDRYPTLDEFADDIERWLSGHTIHARPVGPMETAWRWACRHPLSAGLVAALITVTFTGAILLAVSNSQRGAALLDARQKLQRSLIEQARSERLLGLPGHRARALHDLRQAAALARSPEIRDEAAALLARPDIHELGFQEGGGSSKFKIYSSAGDPMNTSITAPDGDYLLTTHESGMARLWKKNRTEPLQEWIPAPGHEIAADFTPDGKSALIAGTESGIILVNPAFSLQQLVIAPPGPPVRFLTINPAGDKAALARVDGLEVIPLSQAANTWHSGTAQSRCAAAWSADGSRIAMAAGGRREAVILAAENGDVCTTVAVTGMPQHLAFHPDGSLLAIAADDGSIAICETATGTAWTTLHLVAKSLAFTVDGESLRVLDEDGTTQTFPVSLPTAFHEWSEAPRAKADGAVLGMSLSPDGWRTLTISTECIAVWSVKDEHQTGYYLLENQRTDARVSAWWLGDREILLQVPGGLERLAIDSAGKPGESTRVPKVPGSVVLDVRTDGSWIVSVADEEGDRTYELWPGGNPEKAVQTPAPPKPDPKITASHPASGTSAALTDSGAVEVRRPDGSVMRLIPPLSPGVKALLFSQDGRKLILLTRTHRVFSWDLEDLASALDANGL